MLRSLTVLIALAGATHAVAPLQAQRQAPRSAPIRNVRYELTFDRRTAATGQAGVAMAFDVTSAAPVLLSLPAWTPGAYELSFFAAKVVGFAAEQGGTALRWDKVDPDTWRLRPAGAGTVTVRFGFVADEKDNARTWAQPDFLMVNGTNVFPYAEGQSLEFGATVTVRTESDWLVATGMHGAGAPLQYREANYHDLVDMPLFIGRLDLDSVQHEGRWLRLASYPAGRLSGEARAQFWNEYHAMLPPMHRVFNDTPWDSYTTLLLFDSTFDGGSALEHQNSHVGIYNPGFIGTPILTNITAHEIFHAWNVKRLRPAEMVPYRYDVPQPTTLLWVSEGFTNYYADLAMARGGLWNAQDFAEAQTGHLVTWRDGPPVALEDASLSSWIDVADGTRYVYYDKGGLAGFLLDILIRDATDNRASLDDAMRALYDGTWRRGRGFTPEEFVAATSRAAGRPLGDFHARYVDGREPFPWAAVLPLGGFRFAVTTFREPRLGIQTVTDSAGTMVAVVAPGGAGAEAGLQDGDYILAIGDIAVVGESSFVRYRVQYANRDGQVVPLRVRRDGAEVALSLRVRLVAREESRIEIDPDAGDKARRIREGILTGAAGR